MSLCIFFLILLSLSPFVSAATSSGTKTGTYTSSLTPNSTSTSSSSNSITGSNTITKSVTASNTYTSSVSVSYSDTRSISLTGSTSYTASVTYTNSPSSSWTVTNTPSPSVSKSLSSSSTLSISHSATATSILPIADLINLCPAFDGVLCLQWTGQDGYEGYRIFLYVSGNSTVYKTYDSKLPFYRITQLNRTITYDVAVEGLLSDGYSAASRIIITGEIAGGSVRNLTCASNIVLRKRPDLTAVTCKWLAGSIDYERLNLRIRCYVTDPYALDGSMLPPRFLKYERRLSIFNQGVTSYTFGEVRNPSNCFASLVGYYKVDDVNTRSAIYTYRFTLKRLSTLSIEDFIQ